MRGQICKDMEQSGEVDEEIAIGLYVADDFIEEGA